MLNNYFRKNLVLFFSAKMPLKRHPRNVSVCRRASALSTLSSSFASFNGCLLFYVIVLTICLPIFIANSPGVRAAVVVAAPKATKTTTDNNIKTDTAQSKGEFYSKLCFSYAHEKFVQNQ